MIFAPSFQDLAREVWTDDVLSETAGEPLRGDIRCEWLADRDAYSFIGRVWSPIPPPHEAWPWHVGGMVDIQAPALIRPEAAVFFGELDAMLRGLARDYRWHINQAVTAGTYPG